MITTDTGAKKIEGTDNWRQIFSAHNDSVDAYDANVAALQDALGIVVDGNKSAVAASTGQFIILKNSSIVDSGSTMLADGLYTAAKAIPANTVIDKTYLTADANGGLNSLNGKLSAYISIERDNVSLAQNANTGWINWASDDKFCLPVVEQGTYSSSAFGINVDTHNKKWRIINTYAGTQTITYSVIHFK